jgi:hypothetical protein
MQDYKRAVVDFVVYLELPVWPKCLFRK